jgi:hypothetical protein
MPTFNDLSPSIWLDSSTEDLRLRRLARKPRVKSHAYVSQKRFAALRDFTTVATQSY